MATKFSDEEFCKFQIGSVRDLEFDTERNVYVLKSGNSLHFSKWMSLETQQDLINYAIKKKGKVQNADEHKNGRLVAVCAQFKPILNCGHRSDNNLCCMNVPTISFLVYISTTKELISGAVHGMWPYSSIIVYGGKICIPNVPSCDRYGNEIKETKAKANYNFIEVKSFESNPAGISSEKWDFQDLIDFYSEREDQYGDLVASLYAVETERFAYAEMQDVQYFQLANGEMKDKNSSYWFKSDVRIDFKLKK